MALIVEDSIVETSTTTGTGAFTLAGAVTGFRAFSAVMTSPSDTCYYLIEAIDAAGNRSGEWETGLGTYSGANTLTRTTPQRSSNANAAVNFSAGTKRVMISATRAYLAAVANLSGTNTGDQAEATSSQMWTGTSSTVVVTPKKLFDAAAEITLTDGATVTPDFNTGLNFKWTIGGNRTLANPTNAKQGQSGLITITQDATGSRVITYGSNWKFPSGAAATGVLSTAANSVDCISYFVRGDGTILCALNKAFA